MKANLFIVGEQKTGTTTLHYQLSQHSNIQMSRVKEPGYFCTDLRKESDEYLGEKVGFPFRTEEHYNKLFPNSDQFKYNGEASSLYLYSKEAAKKIADYNSNAKIIAIFREPVEYLYSLHYQYIKEGIEDIEDFNLALEAEIDRKDLEKLGDAVKTPSLLYYSERIKFYENLKRYFDLFAKEQILVLIAEEYKSDVEGTYKSVLEFLDLEYENVDLTARNEGGKLRNNLLRSVTTTRNAEKFKSRIANTLPPEMTGKLVEVYHRVSRVKKSRKKIDDKLKVDLRRKFRDEVYKLQSLLTKHGYNYDLLKRWGY